VDFREAVARVEAAEFLFGWLGPARLGDVVLFLFPKVSEVVLKAAFMRSENPLLPSCRNLSGSGTLGFQGFGF
jgi:hypothetical protein